MDASKYEVDKSTGCWNWLGFVSDSGYGLFFLARGRSIAAHRQSYIDRFGPISRLHVIHHECRNRRCVNPNHLRSMRASAHATLHNANTGRTFQDRPDHRFVGMRELEEVRESVGLALLDSFALDFDHGLAAVKLA